jgi:hypothetical protein
MSPQSPNLESVQALLTQKAATDPAFRQTLLSEPRAAIQRELGVAVPADVEIQVVEETPNRICIVLPMEPVHAESRELSEQELAGVTGGLTAMVATGLDRFPRRYSGPFEQAGDKQDITPINLPEIV